MSLFRFGSIRRRLTGAIMASSWAAVLFAGLAFLTYDAVTFRDALRRDLTSLAEIIGANSTAALAFDDRGAASQVLESLRANPHIVRAALYSESGRPFAAIPPSTDEGSALGPEGHAFTSDRLVVTMSVHHRGERFGAIVLESDLELLHERRRRILGVMGAAMAGALGVALLLGWALQKPLAEPLVRLARSAQQVSERQDYSGQVELRASGELGLLVDGFNQMLRAVHEREERLEHQNERLEEAVAERTGELMAVNEELAASMQRAHEASRAKSEFLANMSHEIRTPMNGILGMAELALETEVRTEQREYLAEVRSSAESLLQIINDILDLSKVEAGRLDLERVDFGLREVVAQAVKSLSVRAHEKGLELAYRVAPGVPEAVRGDPGRLRQVLVNLVTNAVKFTERGEVTVQVESGAGEQGENLRVSVTDTGIGIPEDAQERIFEAFTQADGSSTRRFGGTGLGLTICRRLVGLMGGHISVQSVPGQGSTFSFTARLEPAAAPLPQGEGVALRGAHALLAASHALRRRALAESLTSWGMAVAETDSLGGALLALARAGATGQGFDFLVLEAELVDDDGRSDGRLVRTLEQSGARLVLVGRAVGPRSAVGIRRRLGTGSPVTAPATPSDLLEALVASRGAGPGRAPAAPRRSRRPLRVLLAEDNRVNQLLVRRRLEAFGHQVVAVENGREAVAAVARERFDVVLMDVQMPEMDGLQATEAIRRREASVAGPGTPRTFIVALTAHALKGDRERFLAAGMDAYLSKPLEARWLFETLERAGETVATTSDAAPAAPEAALGPRELLARVDGDRALLAELVEVFRTDTPDLLAELRRGVEARDSDGVRKTAHTLKGSLANLGGRAGASVAEALERGAREGRCDGWEGLLADLERETARFTAELVALVREEAAA